MTTERAIEILNPEHREHYESMEPVNEACRMAISALEKQAQSFTNAVVVIVSLIVQVFIVASADRL